MFKLMLACACVVSLSGCDFLSDWFAPPEAPVVEPTPPLPDQPVFSRQLRGDANESFAVIALYRNSFTQSRLVLEAKRQLDAMDLDLMLPECLKLTQGSNTGSYQWKKILVPAGVYEKVVDWERFKPDCPPNGTLFYTVSSGRNGESGSIPFEWIEDVP